MKIKDEIIERLKSQSEDDASSFIITKFTISLAEVLLMDAKINLEFDMPDVRSGGSYISGKRKQENEIKVTDIIRVMNGDDIFRHLKLMLHFEKFFRWYLEQEDPKYEGGKAWRYGWEDTFTIAKMWNEFDLKCAENNE